jgi:hypothetical protein
MLDWLVGNIDIFGVAAQNWMALMVLALGAYAVMLAIGHGPRPTL